MTLGFHPPREWPKAVVMPIDCGGRLAFSFEMGQVGGNEIRNGHDDSPVDRRRSGLLSKRLDAVTSLRNQFDGKTKTA
jgi:hypothetical protein